jgi:hypothetical protein
MIFLFEIAKAFIIVLKELNRAEASVYKALFFFTALSIISIFIVEIMVLPFSSYKESVQGIKTENSGFEVSIMDAVFAWHIS